MSLLETAHACLRLSVFLFSHKTELTKNASFQLRVLA